MLQLGKIEICKDSVGEKLDEMADLCEYWKRNREKGRNPTAIRAALLMLSDELTLIRATEKIPPVDLDRFRTQVSR
jgi:hypothetical protein